MNQHTVDSFLPSILQSCLEASEAILSVYKSHVDAELKADGSPVTVADKQSNTILTEALKKTGIPIISEESCNEDFAVRKDWKHVWIVDPLDGTKEFLKKKGKTCLEI